MPILKKRVYMNGRLVAEDKATVSVHDRGLNYGDGLFETMKAWKGRPVFVPEHMERLKEGARALGFTVKSLEGLFSDIKSGVVEKLLKRNGLTDGEAYVRVTVTRGVGGAGHTPPRPIQPTTIIVARGLESGPIEVLQRRGVKAVTVRGALPALPSIKTLNFLPNILGKAAALKNGAFEGIFIGPDNLVREGTSSNVFAVTGDAVKTPPAGNGDGKNLPGVTRAKVLELASAEGLKPREVDFTADELAGSSEVFITNSILEVVPVTRLDSKKIGTGAPGPATRLLQRLVRELIRA